MAQVIRKYQEGGKTKPTIVKIDGKDYNYDDIEKNVWGNFEAHAKANNWDAETQNAVRDYLEYSLAGLKSGELSYGHNKMNNVSQEYESDGTFNTKGKGLFKRDITNDKRAGATLGTAYYNTLFNNNVMDEYKAPELKKIGASFTQDLANTIMNNNFGGNAQAMQEAWSKMSPQDRYTMFRQAVASLNYSPDEYADVDTYNRNRALFLQQIENGFNPQNGLSQGLIEAYSRLGGYGLDNLINGTTQSTTQPTTKNIEQHREEWKQEAINAGYETPQAIADYVALKEKQYYQQQSGISTTLQDLNKADQYKQAGDFVDEYIKQSKARLSQISSRKYLINWEKLDNDPTDKLDLSELNQISLLNRTKQMTQQFKQGKFNPYEWRGLISALLDKGLQAYQTSDGSQLYVIPYSADMNSESVIVFDGNALSIRSIHDFPDLFSQQFNQKFISIYKQRTGIDLPSDWVNQLSTLTGQLQSAYQQQSPAQHKNGGILKMQDGAAFMRAMSGNPTMTYDQAFYNQSVEFENQKRHQDIERANDLGITVEELKAQEAEEKEQEKHRKEQIFGKDSMETEDYLRLGSLLQDVGALVTSFGVGAGTLTSGALGLTSAATDFVADMLDEGVSASDMWKNLGFNTVLAGVGMVPGGKAGSLGAKILKWAPRIIAGLGASFQATPFINAIKKGQSKGFSSLSREDWKNIYYGIKIATQGGAGVVRSRRNAFVDKHLMTPTTGEKTTIKTNSGREITLSSKQVKDLQGKTNKEAVEYLRKAKDPEHPGEFLLGESEGLEQSKSSKFASWATRGRLGKQFEIKTKSGDKRIMTPEEVTAKYKGELPANYVDWIIKNPDAVTPEQYAKVLKAARESGNFLSKYNTPENIERLLRYNSVNPIMWFGDYDFSGIRQKGRINSPFSSASTSSPSTPSPSTTQVPAQPIRDQKKLTRILENIKTNTGTTKKKPTLQTITNENKALYDKKDQSNVELVAFITDDGNIKLLNAKDSKFKTIDKKRVVSIKTQVETESGRMSLADAFAQGKQIKFDPKFLKHGGIFLNNVVLKYTIGGSIPKYETGNEIVGNVSTNNSNWHDTIFSKYWDDLLTGLKDNQFTIDDLNNMQSRHSRMYANYDPNKGAYVGPDNYVGNYQSDIINKYGFVNTKGINNGWDSGRYSTVQNRSYNKDGVNKTYDVDNVYGGQTDDRRILGRKGDFTDDQLNTYNTQLKDLGYEMYLDTQGNNYYKLRKLTNPTASTQQTKTDPVTGETLQYDPKTGKYVAIGGSNPQNKPKIQRIGEDVLKYVKNINPADAIALGKALWGENVNNKVSELVKQMQGSLLDPQHQTAILHGDYTAKMLAQELAGKINAAAQKPISNDAGTNYAARLEAAQKATQALQQGNAEDSEMYWKTLQILNSINNENAAQEVATGNENRGKVTALYNNRLQAEAARLTANFEQIWQPFLNGIEKRYRDEDVLRRQAEIDAWKYKVTDRYQAELQKLQDEYRQNRALAAKNWTGTADDFETEWATKKAPAYNQKIQEIYRNMYNELYDGLSRYYSYTPFQLKRTPEIATPGINGNIYRNYATKGLKSGGTLSAAERQALKTTNEINKNIRQAARETYKNIREDKREHRKAMALVSQLSADLIKKAVGIK